MKAAQYLLGYSIGWLLARRRYLRPQYWLGRFDGWRGR